MAALYQEGHQPGQGREKKPLRFGILGAARIAPNALIKPARQLDGVEVSAIAARSPIRAQEFARKQAIPRTHATYADLLADDAIDAVYIALPNSLHAEWSQRALEAGKHVLCEKPMSSNAGEAGQVAATAEQSGRVYAEAFHNLYHPLAHAMHSTVQEGAIGNLKSVRGVFNTTIVRRADIRFEYALAGGALMDLGCYLVSLTRYVLGAELEVESAASSLLKPNVDARTEARLRVVKPGATSDLPARTQTLADRSGGIPTAELHPQYLLTEADPLPDGSSEFPTATTTSERTPPAPQLLSNPEITLECAMQRWRFPAVYYEVIGEQGSMRVINPILPQLYNRVTIEIGGKRTVQHLPRISTYLCQLRAFAQAVQGGDPIPTDAAWGVGNMQVIDAIYQAAGLPMRGLRTLTPQP